MSTFLHSPVSRRGVLRGGALIVSFALAPSLPLLAQERLPGSLQGAPSLDAWIRIGADGAVTAFTGKCELGQGIKTALIQVAAEQLCVELKAVTLITSDTGQTPAEGYTAGSQSMQDSATAIQHAAAQARDILVKLAGEKLGVPADQLKAENGAVVAADGRRLGYGELVAENVFKVRAQPQSNLIKPENFRIVGKSVPRVDIPAKVTGQPAYVHDLRLEGMVHARVVRPPSYGATLANVDVAAVERLPGVRKVVRDGNFLAVTADREFRAVKAMEALAAASRWNERDTMPEQAGLYGWLKQQPGRTITIKDEKTSLETAARSLEAEYLRPYQMHASIGPSCAVAQYKDDVLTVWSHAQGMFPLRQAVAQLLKLPPERVRCIHMEGAGCYGHNGADDAAADAAYLAFNDPGVPVRVQWMRHQEHQWEPYGSGMSMMVKGSLDAQGRILDWDFTVFTDTHNTRPGGAGSTLVGQHIATPFTPPPPNPGSQPTGAGDRNIIPLYKTANTRLIYQFHPHQALRVSALRGLGAYGNVFAIECFMDELAAAAGVDPVEFRVRHLQDQRAIDVISRTAAMFDWSRESKALPKGRGRGIAFSRYKNLGAYCAVAVELDVEHETGRIRLRRAVSACDSGQMVNPDGIKNQIEGGIIQAASWTLSEQVNFDKRRITSRDWSRYPILRFGDMFDSVAVEVVDRPGLPFLGTGEASQGPTGAAIANAVMQATGKRIRELPLNPPRVKAAIGV